MGGGRQGGRETERLREREGEEGGRKGDKETGKVSEGKGKEREDGDVIMGGQWPNTESNKVLSNKYSYQVDECR